MNGSPVDFTPLGEAIRDMWDSFDFEGCYHWLPVVGLLNCNIPI